MLPKTPTHIEKNKAIRVLDRWINTEFLSQESQEKIKNAIEIKLEDLDSETVIKTVKDKLREVREKVSSSREWIESTLIYGHIDRKKYTDYLNEKYSKNIKVSFSEWDFIEFGRSTYYYNKQIGNEEHAADSYSPLFMADHFLEEDPDVSFDSSYYKKYCDYIHEKHPGEFGLLKEFVSEVNAKKNNLNVDPANNDAAVVYIITKPRKAKYASNKRTSFVIKDLESLKEKISNDEFGSTAYEASVLRLIIDEHLDTDDELRVNITPGNSNVDPLFRKYLDKSCYPVGKWPEEGIRRPYLMQQLAINLFEGTECEELPIFSVNGPPGTGKTTLLKEIIADTITKKVKKMAEILDGNGCDPDKLLECDELLEYSIVIASQNNAAVKNITSKYPKGIKDDMDYIGLPLMATLGNSRNFYRYGEMNRRVKSYENKKIGRPNIEKLKSDIEAFLDLYEQTERKRKRLKADMNLRTYEQMQRSNTYADDSFDKLREELFISAWKLHQAIAWNSSAVHDAFVRYLKSVKESDDSVEDSNVGRSIFFISPVVSSTFASFERVFLCSREKALCGVLIVDESGQVQTKDAAGALMRARRALIVGDPKQIPPVVPPHQKYAYEFYQSDETDIEMITEDDVDDCNFNEDDIPSLQRSADAINPYGTYIGNTWVGCPLVLHNRCISPMFDISNRLSYARTMIKNTQDSSENGVHGLLFDKSYWIQVKGREGYGKRNHFVLRQAEVVHKLIRKKYGKKNTKKNVSLFVITPFKSVSEGMKKYIEHYDSDLKDFAKTNIGTIHTFQGKEADEVILLLGCSSESENAARWISKNMVNVAASRAKYRLYIVGDMDLFRRREGQPESPVNQARRIMQKYYKELNLGDCKLGLKDINDLLGLGVKDRVGTRKEKKQYKCPRCERSVIKGSNGWFCYFKCGMQFHIKGYPIDSTSISKLLAKKEDVWVTVNKLGKRYHLFPDSDHIIRSSGKDGEDYYVYDTSKDDDLIAKETVPVPDSTQDYLYCNCSTFVNKFRKEIIAERIVTEYDENGFDYFDIMILDAIYTIQEEEKKTRFNSYDILIRLSGKSNPDPKSVMRKIIDDRVERMTCKNIYGNVVNVHDDGSPWKYYLLPQVKKQGDHFVIDTGTDGKNNSYLFKYIREADGKEKVSKSIVKFPRYLLDGRYVDNNCKTHKKKGEPIFPSNEKWLKIKYYLLYRIALMYRAKKLNNSINFDSMKKSLHLTDDQPESRVKNKRFKDRIEAYMDFLVREKYIKGYKPVPSNPNKSEGYCGIKRISITLWGQEGTQEDK